jgi:hypothetical protein
MSGRVASLLLLLLMMCAGCASVEVTYEGTTRTPRDVRDVEVFDNSPPWWDYAVVGDFQEKDRDSIAGGRSGRRALFASLAADRGCDGVVLGGNVSVFDGRYEHEPQWASVKANLFDLLLLLLSPVVDTTRHRTSPEPVFELRGLHAQCVVRLDGRAPRRRAVERSSAVPTSYPLFGSPE